MTESASDPRQQFATVELLLTRWLRERRGLLAGYTQIVVSLDAAAPLGQRLQALCGQLVDYCSAGHFEVFHQLVTEAECFHDGSEALAGRVLPAIGDTTEVILAFEEKYGADSASAAPGAVRRKLKRDLTALGEVLETRFDLEDRLIAGMHSRHRGLVM